MWNRFDLDGTTVQGFTMQSANIDGTDISPVVSDTVLGAGGSTAMSRTPTRPEGKRTLSAS